MVIFHCLLGLSIYTESFVIFYKVALDEAIYVEIGGTGTRLTVFWFIQALFVIDILLNFVIVTRDTELSTLASIRSDYLRGYFIIDFIPTVICAIMLFSQDETATLWAWRLKSIRILRVSYMTIFYKGLLEHTTAHIPRIRNLLDFIITSSIKAFFILHILTCIWIKLGSLDAKDDKYLEIESDEVSWMFIPGSDFSGDPRSIYDQIIDESSPMDL